MVHLSALVKFQLKSSQLETDNNGQICYVLDNWLIKIGQTQEKTANMNPRKNEIKVISKCSFYRLGRGNQLKGDFYSYPDSG